MVREISRYKLLNGRPTRLPDIRGYSTTDDCTRHKQTWPRSSCSPDIVALRFRLFRQRAVCLWRPCAIRPCRPLRRSPTDPRYRQLRRPCSDMILP